MSQTRPARDFLDQARARLQSHRQELRERIAAQTGAEQREAQAALAAEVHDRGEESLVNLLAGVHYAGIAHDLEEARDVEAALRRVTEGSYGFCLDCSLVISEARLVAYPTAKRCRTCQESHEAVAVAGVRR